jgi:hypothetical protein
MRQLDTHLQGYPAHVILIDDGSTAAPPDHWGSLPLQFIEQVEILRLRRNLGHQRALAVGLSYIEANRPCRAVLVMDGDGEDDPADVPRLLGRLEEEHDGTIVFAQRAKRAEGLGFRAGYVVYRFLHRLLTGIAVRVGNFSVIPMPLLSRLVVVSDLWNHYAASVFKARLPYVSVPTERAPRLGGRSHMNFVALVSHGLCAISVFTERVAVRLLVALAALFVVASMALLATSGIRLLTDVAIPGWATSAAGILIIVLLQLLTLMFVFVFLVLGGRESAQFLPLRDYVFFVMHTVPVWPTAPPRRQSSDQPDPIERFQEVGTR